VRHRVTSEWDTEAIIDELVRLAGSPALQILAPYDVPEWIKAGVRLH